MFYTIEEIAHEWKVAQNTVYRWITDGKLRANKIGGVVRISEESKKEFENKGGDAKKKT